MVKKLTRNFVYFVLVAPILAKLIEWGFQIVQPNALDFIKQVWFSQIIFIEILAIGTWFIYSRRGKLKLFHWASIVGIAYFLKELYNLIFIFKVLNQITLIALIIEPIFMFVVVGIIIPRRIFKEKFFK